MEMKIRNKSELNSMQRALKSVGIPKSAITVVKNSNASSNLSVLIKYKKEFEEARQLLSKLKKSDDKQLLVGEQSPKG